MSKWQTGNTLIRNLFAKDFFVVFEILEHFNMKNFNVKYCTMVIFSRQQKLKDELINRTAVHDAQEQILRG